MKFIHTADWHLGRIFHGLSLVEDQAWALDRLVELVRAEKPDAVLVAGDVYDRAVPPADAVRLLDDVLFRLVLGEKVPVLLSAGNHDSPERLQFGSRLLEAGGLHVVGVPDARPACVSLADAHGPVDFHLLPYAEPAIVREKTGDAGVRDQASALRTLLARRLPPSSPAARSILVAHAFVTGAATCESERPLSVGGADAVPCDVFDGFHYVALGHLHRPQSLGAPAAADGAGAAIQYSGSLCKYSFSEAGHTKGVLVVEMDAVGRCAVRRVPLGQRRDMRRLEGSIAELLLGPAAGESADDYLEVCLTDAVPVFDAIGRLRAVYPNVLQVRRPEPSPAGADSPVVDHRKIGDLELFSLFFQETTGGPMSPAHREVLAGVLAKLDREEREVRP